MSEAASPLTLLLLMTDPMGALSESMGGPFALQPVTQWQGTSRLFAHLYRQNCGGELARISFDQFDEASMGIDERDGREPFHTECAQRRAGRVKRQWKGRFHLGLVFGQRFGASPHMAHHAKPLYAPV